MKLTEAMGRYDEGLFEPMMIVLHTDSAFPGGAYCGQFCQARLSVDANADTGIWRF